MPAIENEHTELIWRRVDGVVQLILENDRYLNKNRTPELTEMVERQFEVSTRQAQRYIGEAKKIVRKLSKEKSIRAFEKAVRDREFLLSKLKSGDERDYKLALEVMKDIAKLHDLYPEKKVVQDNVNYDIDLNKFTDHGLERIKSGDDPREVLLDPQSVRIEDND